MRGSMFLANPWSRQPMRPIVSVRLAQAPVCDGDVCRIPPPPTQQEVPPPPAPTPTQPSAPAGENVFPVVPVAIGAGALVLAALLFGR